MVNILGASLLNGFKRALNFVVDTLFKKKELSPFGSEVDLEAGTAVVKTHPNIKQM